MIEAYWASLFKSFYERVRVKVACRCPVKIPAERLYEMDKELYLISFIVEGLDTSSKSSVGDEDDDDKGGDEEFNDDDCDDLDDSEDMDNNKVPEKPPPTSPQHGCVCGGGVACI
jgi:hypothetical protein